jgi:RimJ/RimL family protein N-acetyltransferase
VIETERLRLRPFQLEDAPEVQRLCGAREIAASTLNIPHPYPDGAAEEWISGHGKDGSVTFAIERKEDGALVGAVGLRMEADHARAELGYWVGVPYWGRGYATEAAGAAVRHGFEAKGLNRIYAFHFTNNPASGRVLQKIGMTHEGRRRAHTRKWGEYLDNEAYGILRGEWS